MASNSLPMPPLELRRLVGPTDPEDFDNPSGVPIYAEFDVPLESYDSIFDFGCGCGRLARKLLQQDPRPRQYIGVDPHKGMIRWCADNLSAVDSSFQFYHHNVYSPGYAPENSLQLAEPFPAEDESVSLFIAHSVFTHLCRPQTEYYLSELRRVLKPDGIAFTSWFFFDRASFPFLREGPFCLYTSEADFSQAVIYDRNWFFDAIREAGLSVKRTIPPGIPGHQWMLFLVQRTPNSADQFLLGDDGAEWLCGVTSKAAAKPTWSDEYIDKARGEKRQVPFVEHTHLPRRQPPPLFGPLAALQQVLKAGSGKR